MTKDFPVSLRRLIPLTNHSQTVPFGDPSETLYRIAAVLALGAQIIILTVNLALRPLPPAFLLAMITLIGLCAITALVETRQSGVGMPLLAVLINLWAVGVYRATNLEIVLLVLPLVGMVLLLLHYSRSSLAINLIGSAVVMSSTEKFHRKDTYPPARLPRDNGIKTVHQSWQTGWTAPARRRQG